MTTQAPNEAEHTASDPVLHRGYLHIVAWNTVAGANHTYITDLCALADQEAAPKDAIYKNGMHARVQPGEWITYGEMGDPDDALRVAALVRTLEAPTAEPTPTLHLPSRSVVVQRLTPRQPPG
ncbi:hypothetical protein [Streptomyces microflavus]|uniref:hypothetical protein n=1 Tax=Streptomyces microflavus TaxID=1919 RepID=UPI0033A745AB